MFDFAWSELALIGVVGLLFIGPKDMPVAIRTVTNLLKKGRKLAGEFQTHVDDMVREADFGEARDQLRQLKSFNVRGQIMKALDSDGSIKRTLEQRPLADMNTAPRFAPPTESLPVGDASAGSNLLSRESVRPMLGTAAGDRSWATVDSLTGLEDETLIAADPAPSIVPPPIARRLRAERAQPHPPSFLPPRTVHTQAVRLDRGTRTGAPL